MPSALPPATSARLRRPPPPGSLRPRPLRPGARVALLAPASPVFEPAEIDRAVARIASLGLVPVLGDAARRRHGYLAGPDAARIEDLHRAFADDDIAAIWSLRGGYGCARLLPELDYELIARHPKAVLGFSDLTALHAALGKLCGLVSFHAPMATNELAPYEVDALRRVVMTEKPAGRLGAPPEAPPGPGQLGGGPHPRAIRGGKAEGRLLGGNLSVLTRLCGTPFFPDLKGAILALEDIGEATYRVDGMLTQLRLAGALDGVAGVALGAFTGTDSSQPSQLPLGEAFEELLGNLGVPVLEGLCFGHIARQTTLPLGIRARLDADAGTLEALESAVRSA